MEETIIPGIETMRGCALPPSQIHIEFKLAQTLQGIQTVANSKWIAVIPYCAYCRVPLDWVRNSQILHRCPKCHTEWLKSVTWKEELNSG